MDGLFITFEGIDGCGKSTQAEKLYNYFKELGEKVLLTREPGGTNIGEKIREIIIDKKNSEMSSLTEAFLYVAARAQHVHEIIRPALLDNYIVICDRFLDSSIAYQGVARGLGLETVEIINSYAIGALKPDITFTLEIEPEIALGRKIINFDLDRIESEKLDFHKKVYSGYMQLAKKNADRIVIIDGNLSADFIYEKVINVVTNHIKRR